MLKKLSHPRSLVIVLLLPLLVLGIGMWALTGRVDAVEQVPAAVVNLDDGATMEVDGEEQEVPLGRQLAGGLTQPDTVDNDGEDPDDPGFDWQLTTEDDAEDGLQDGSYSAVIIIPEDFSENLASIGSTDAAKAQVEVFTNDASGALDSLIGESVAQAAANTMGGQFTEQYLDQLYVGFNDMQENFSDVADGAGDLADGSDQLAGGLSDTADGAGDLADGSEELADGSQELAAGTPELADGADQLASGVGEFSGGLNGLADGVDGVADGVGGLSDGLGQLSEGADGLSGGISQLDEGINGDGSGENPGLVGGASQLAGGLSGDGTEENPGLVGGTEELAGGAEEYASGVGDYAGGVKTGYQGLRNGTGDQPGLPDGARRIADGVDEYAGGVSDYADGVQDLSDALGAPLSDQQPPEIQSMEDAMAAVEQACSEPAPQPDPDNPEETPPDPCRESTELLVGYAQAADEGLNGDGSQENPGLVDSGQQLKDGADGISEGAYQYADGVEQGLEQTFVGEGRTSDNPTQESLLGGARALSDGAGGVAEGNREMADQMPALADGANELAGGIEELGSGVPELADGADQLADGVDESAEGAGQLADGADQLADGARQSADGAGSLSSGADELAGGTQQLAEGTQGIADGQSGLAEGTRGLADGTDQLADAGSELSDGTGDLASGLDDAAEGIPTYDKSERDRMSAQASQPIDTFNHRDNEADGASTATFPFVASLALWLGAFASFLLLPALSKKLLASAVPMWLVVLRSMVPGLLIGLIQTVAVLATLTAIGIAPISPLAVGLVSLLGAAMFVAFHQALLTVFGERVGRIASIVLMVLQVVILAGILPMQTAPQLLQDVGGYMPLTVVSQGLVHASLGGTLTSTSTTLLGILAWLVGSVVVTLVFSRGARTVKPSRGGVKVSTRTQPVST